MTTNAERLALANESTLDLAWTKLLDDTPPPEPVVIKMENSISDSPIIPTETPQLKNSPSWLGSFHKQLRMSIKAVTDSPGPITR